MTLPYHLTRLYRGTARCTAALKRAVALVSLLAVGASAAALAPASAAATPLPRINLKVLLLGTSATQSDLVDWQAALQREGVPFTTILTSTANRPAITAASLSSSLTDGTPVANYDAVIVANGGLIDCSAGCASGLSQAEWDALEQYERQFNIRQISGDVNPGQLPSPGPVYGTGMNLPTLSGALDGVNGTLTASGQKAFSYLNASAPITIGTVGSTTGSSSFGYEAAPISTTNFDTLVGGPGGTSLVGIYTHPDGVQELIETYAQNQYLLQDQLLRHGAIAWVTRGVYFGDQRNYVETHIDDTFIGDDVWNVATHANNYDASAAVRETASDVDYAASWSHTNNFRIDNLFNGVGGTTTDPLLAEFKKPDPFTGKAYSGSFGWVNHTWDHPNLDTGCATTNYIATEISNNNSWATSATGLGLKSSTDPTAALGTNNPGVVVTGEHSGLANLIPGNPGTVDPPGFDQLTAASTGGSLSAGSITYAITDQFSATGGESSASTATVTVPTGSTTGSVALTWEAACHAADYKIYRQAAGTNTWTLVTTVPATSGDFTDAGPKTLSYTDNGSSQGAAPWTTPPTDNAATETPYQQNANLVSAFNSVGLTVFGTDASKPYPDPATATTGFSSTGYSGPTTAAGATFAEPGTAAAAVPRYPTNIYYNVATQAEEVDEYNHIYLPPAADGSGGVCDSAKTACLSTPATFTDIVNSVVNNGGGMFQHMMGNDPRPHYFHQSNMIGGSGALYYSVMNQLLKEYNSYFNSSAPITQLTMPQIAALLAQQSRWAADQGASTPTVSGYIQGNQVTVTNTGSAVTQMPLTGVTGVGSAYAGTQSGWTAAPASGASANYTAQITWPVDAISVSLAPPSIVANGTATSVATATLTADGKPVAGEPVTFTSSDAGEKISAVTDNKNGTYTATITSSTTIGTPTITATDSAVFPTASGTATLAQGVGPAATVKVSLTPATIAANGTAQSTATAQVSDAQGHGVAGDNLAFASSDAGEKVGAVTDNKDGTYTATITSSTTIGTPTITATDSSVTPAVSGQATLTQGVGPATSVTVSLAPATIAANGTAQSKATAHVSDTAGHAIAGDQVSFASSDAGEKVGGVTDNKDGTYTATITSSTTTGTATITATDSSVTPTVAGKATLTQGVGPAATVTVSLSPASIAANGTAQSTATVHVSDAQGHAVAGDHVGLASSDAGEKISAVTDKKDGTYTATITSSTTTGTATITATDSSVTPTVAGKATLTQGVGPASAVSVSVSPAAILANGTATTTATARVSDAQGHAVAGDHVAFASDDPGEKISAVTDNQNGTYTATITSSTKAGTVTITATDSSVSPAVSGRASVSQTTPTTAPVNVKAPTISGTPTVGQTLTAAPGTWTGTAPIRYAYQWQRCAPGCTAIAGATAASRRVATADRGARLRVLVTATNVKGTAQAVSAQIGPVTARTNGVSIAANVSEVKALLAHLLVPTGKGARLAALVGHNGYAWSAVTLPAPSRLQVEWYARGTRVLIARVTANVRTSHRVKVNITLTRAGRRRLDAAGKQVRMTAHGTLSVAGLSRVTLTRGFAVSR